MIIEEHISGPQSTWATTPTVNCLILSDGTIEVVGTGRMLMRRGWLYSGICSGYAALEPSTEETIVRIGRQVGHAMADMGYAGWFDIDFVVGARGEIFLTEINARRASPAHAFAIARRTLGEGWPRKCSLYANDHLPLQGSCNPRYPAIREVFAAFNGRHSRSSIKAVPTIVSSSLSRKTPYLGYVLLAQGESEAGFHACRLEQEIREAIGMMVGD